MWHLHYVGPNLSTYYKNFKNKLKTSNYNYIFIISAVFIITCFCQKRPTSSNNKYENILKDKLQE